MTNDRRRRFLWSAEENDTHTGWRHVMTMFKRPGLAKKGKKRTNRRERRDARHDIQDQVDNQ